MQERSAEGHEEKQEATAVVQAREDSVSPTAVEVEAVRTTQTRGMLRAADRTGFRTGCGRKGKRRIKR